VFLRTENRRQRTEDRRQKTEDRRQKTEDRRQKTEDRRQCRVGEVCVMSRFKLRLWLVSQSYTNPTQLRKNM